MKNALKIFEALDAFYCHKISAIKQVEFLLRCKGTVLNAGSGGGALSPFRPSKVTLVNVDLAVENPSKFVLQANLNHDWEFDMTFDNIICSDVIEHLENPSHFFRQAFKVLKSGGTLFVSTPDVTKTKFFTGSDPMVNGHISPQTEDTLNLLATRAGFTVSLSYEEEGILFAEYSK